MDAALILVALLAGRDAALCGAVEESVAAFSFERSPRPARPLHVDRRPALDRLGCPVWRCREGAFEEIRGRLVDAGDVRELHAARVSADPEVQAAADRLSRYEYFPCECCRGEAWHVSPTTGEKYACSRCNGMGRTQVIDGPGLTRTWRRRTW